LGSARRRPSRARGFELDHVVAAPAERLREGQVGQLVRERDDRNLRVLRLGARLHGSLLRAGGSAVEEHGVRLVARQPTRRVMRRVHDAQIECRLDRSASQRLALCFTEVPEGQ